MFSDDSLKLVFPDHHYIGLQEGVEGRVKRLLVDEEDVEAQAEGSKEDNKDNSKLCNTLQDVAKHEDEDSKEWDVAEVCEEVEPGNAHKK